MAVYFIRAGEDGPVKIGYATDVRQRMSKMQSDTPEVLTLIGQMSGGADVESKLHHRFSHVRLRGEWFSATAEMLALAQANPPPAKKKRLISDTPLGRFISDNGMTSAQFAALIGVSGAVISRVLNGVDGPSWETMRKIEVATGGAVTPNDFRYPKAHLKREAA